MRKILNFLILFIFIINPTICKCEIFKGEVAKLGAGKSNRIIDSKTNNPINGAKISIPKQNFNTITDKQGGFDLDTKINGQTVMSVEKNGYKPFSITINEKTSSTPLVLGIEKSTPKDIIVETNMFHLGDNVFSEQSANADEFHVQSIGPFYSKNFKIPHFSFDKNPFLIIGSIIGVDTKLAKSMGQNKVTNAYSSPPEVYFNGSKIAEIQLNGDGQKIKIPKNLLKAGELNEVTIKTGRNLMQTSHVDYDDIEFMNLTIETN